MNMNASNAPILVKSLRTTETKERTRDGNGEQRREIDISQQTTHTKKATNHIRKWYWVRWGEQKLRLPISAMTKYFTIRRIMTISNCLALCTHGILCNLILRQNCCAYFFCCSSQNRIVDCVLAHVVVFKEMHTKTLHTVNDLRI